MKNEKLMNLKRQSHYFADLNSNIKSIMINLCIFFSIFSNYTQNYDFSNYTPNYTRIFIRKFTYIFYSYLLI